MATDHTPNKNTLFFKSQRHTNVLCNTHIHPEAEIVLVTEGTLHMTIDKKDYCIRKDSCVFIPPFSPHNFRSVEDNRCHVLIFSTGFVPFFSEAIVASAPSCHMFSPERALLRQADILLPDDHNEPNAICIQAVLAPLCQSAYAQCRFSPRKQPLDDSAALLLDYINEHYTEDLSLQTVAKAVGIHPVTVSKIFSKRTGVSFHFHLQYLRCSYATRLLQGQNMTISEIAYEVGFGSTRSFNRAFQTIYGKTPSQYRAEFR